MSIYIKICMCIYVCMRMCSQNGEVNEVPGFRLTKQAIYKLYNMISLELRQTENRFEKYKYEKNKQNKQYNIEFTAGGKKFDTSLV